LQLVPVITFSNENVIHPAPKEPKLISNSLLPSFKKQLTPPPGQTDQAQKRDESELLSLQKSRTSEDCKRAASEVMVSVNSFFGPPYGPLNSTTAKKLAPFFEQVRNDADYYIQLLKKEYPRQRPLLYMKNITPCVAKEVTGAYPSGHSTIAKLYALILSDLYPNKKEDLLRRADQIALDRVVVGMHHPTDIQTGKKLGEMVYAELKKSKSFSESFSAIKPESVIKLTQTILVTFQSQKNPNPILL